MARQEEPKNEMVEKLLDQMDFHGLPQEEVLGKDGLIKALTKRVLERALEAEMDHRVPRRAAGVHAPGRQKRQQGPVPGPRCGLGRPQACAGYVAGGDRGGEVLGGGCSRDCGTVACRTSWSPAPTG
jgi:hypothetical protein